MKKFCIAALAALFTMTFACISAKAQEYYIESIKVEQDGSITVRVYGNGRNKTDALDLAKKNACYDVIFKGITRGVAKGIYTRPLLPTVNAREKYQEYFDIFFMDKGEYTKYVSSIDKRAFSNKHKNGSVQVEYETTVRVLIPQLRARLIADGVLKKVED